MPVLTCNRCEIDLLIAQCPHNPNAPKITPLNLVEVTGGTREASPVIPANIVTRSMLQDPNHILEERDTASIARAKKKKTRRKRSLNASSSNPSSKTKIETGDDPMYINDPEDDSDSIETKETKTATIRKTSNEDNHERASSKDMMRGGCRGSITPSPPIQGTLPKLTNPIKDPQE